MVLNSYFGIYEDQRVLAVIMFTDIVGYTSLMGSVDPIFHPLREEPEFQNLIEASYQRQDNVRQILNEMQVEQELKWMVEG